MFRCRSEIGKFLAVAEAGKIVAVDAVGRFREGVPGIGLRLSRRSGRLSPRGMESPANGIFILCRARSGWKQDRERCKGASGRLPLRCRQRICGRSLPAGKGTMFGQRQVFRCPEAAAGAGCPGMAAGTTAGIAAGFVFTAWPANGPVAPAIAAPDGGVPAFRRCPDSVPPTRPVRGLWTMRREERRRNIALRSGGSVFRPENPANTAACVHLRAARTRCSGARSMHDNCCYRASIR